MKILVLMTCAFALAVAIPANGSPAPPPDIASEVQRLKLEARMLSLTRAEDGEAVLLCLTKASQPTPSEVRAPVTPEPNSRLHPWDFG